MVIWKAWRVLLHLSGSWDEGRLPAHLMLGMAYTHLGKVASLDCLPHRSLQVL